MFRLNKKFEHPAYSALCVYAECLFNMSAVCTEKAPKILRPSAVVQLFGLVLRLAGKIYSQLFENIYINRA